MRAAGLLLAGVVACGPRAAVSPPADWVELGSTGFDAEGKTPRLRAPWAAAQRGLALEVRAPAGRCVQVDELTDDAGRMYVGPAGPGPHCTGCEQRVSVAAGGGLFVLPSRAGPFAPSGGLNFRLGLRDCSSLTQDVPRSAGETLEVRARAAGRPPAHGRLVLRLILTPASSFHPLERAAALASLLEAINAELAPAQVSASWAEVIRLPAGARSDADFSRGEPGALTGLLAQAPSGEGIRVVLAGCLRLADPALGKSSEVQGYTPHIPGGAGPADAIFLGGSLCGTPGPVRVEWAPSAAARVLAHELGHYLGLYHSVEADGSLDQLEDTGPENLMFHRPGQAGATGLSAAQGELVRAHPAVAPAD